MQLMLAQLAMTTAANGCVDLLACAMQLMVSYCEAFQGQYLNSVQRYGGGVKHNMLPGVGLKL